MYRLVNQDPALLADPNTDDGNRNFDKGVVMNRLDLLSEFDVNYKKFGVHFSGAGYYDTVYNKINDNDSPGTVNHDITEVPYNEFTDDTIKLHGKNVELLDAFTFGSLYLGSSQLTYKAGQYSLLWGTTFFPSQNGIADGMSPVNVAKAASMPNVMMKDVLLPYPQVSANLQVTDDLRFGAYYQLKWEGVRLWGSGSYFSPVDLIIKGGDRIIAEPGVNFIRGEDLEPEDQGQFGVQTIYQSPIGVDFGAYYLRYHSRGPQVYTELEMATPPGAPPFIVVPFPTSYHLVYPENIQAYAVSANASIDIWTIGAEVSYRTNYPLVSSYGPLMPGQTADNDENPLYAVGKTLNANVNVFMPNLPANFLCDTATLIFEVYYNKRLSVDKNEAALDATKNETAVKAKLVYEPKWFQFLPAFDLIVPIGAEYTPKGNSSVLDMGPDKGGMWTIGVGGTYDNLWDLALTYVNYFGDTKYQSIADRDYVGFYIRRAF